ncbi:MAG: 7-cyano-7-deazaguanine synthase [Elusimicrobiaceae bacterium]|nr:7-cyano-7-deazaguanine synthase [Elusimicrobiaceae bacterium]
MTETVILSLSGGLDSCVCYFYLQSLGYAVRGVNFSYGSKHNARERAAAEKLCPGLLKLELDFSQIKSDLLLSGGPVPDGHYHEIGMKSTVVPFRNGIMLSYLAAIAESSDCRKIAIANHSGDHALYPDCRTEFITALNGAVALGTYSKVGILSPFSEINKTDIVALGKKLGIERQMYDSWSCYRGGESQCGTCATCAERREAFVNAGLPDLTRYGELVRSA